MAHLIKTTQDGRKIEVIGENICIDGVFEANTMTPIHEHPNSRDILKLVPKATHMAGRIVLEAGDAAAVHRAFIEARKEMDMSPAAIAERLRRNAFERQRMAGIE